MINYSNVYADRASFYASRDYESQELMIHVQATTESVETSVKTASSPTDANVYTYLTFKTAEDWNNFCRFIERIANAGMAI